MWVLPRHCLVMLRAGTSTLLSVCPFTDPVRARLPDVDTVADATVDRRRDLQFSGDSGRVDLTPFCSPSRTVRVVAAWPSCLTARPC